VISKQDGLLAEHQNPVVEGNRGDVSADGCDADCTCFGEEEMKALQMVSSICAAVTGVQHPLCEECAEKVEKDLAREIKEMNMMIDLYLSLIHI